MSKLLSEVYKFQADYEISICFGFPTGNVPCSFLYGVVVDAACLVWDMVCGKEGACSLYDRTAFRRYFHGWWPLY